jgi:hypothetical protein
MQIINRSLNAYAILPEPQNLHKEEDNTVEMGFFDEENGCDDPFFVPFHLLTEGYHYTHGGDEYKKLCEWVKEQGDESLVEFKKRVYVKAKIRFLSRGKKEQISYIGPFADMAQAVRYCNYFDYNPYEGGQDEDGRPILSVVRRTKVEDAEPPDFGFEGELLKRESR